MQFLDQMHRQVDLPQFPERIVSLVPSQTELLFHLGLGDRVVGVTRFCLHPREEVRKKTRVGGTKQFHLEVIDQLAPDLIIGNKEENYQEGIEALAQKYPVWMSDILTLEDSLQMMAWVGEITNTATKAQELVSQLQEHFLQLHPISPRIRTAYFIWRKPYMAVGGENFIDHVLARCGLENVVADMPRYPVITPELLQERAPQLILLSSEPYPFQERHLAEFQQICPDALVKVVDGEMFSWYGSRLLHSVPYLQDLLRQVQQDLPPQ
ncbi:helical backbone metal receptor [Rufibacter quisquiliarum]|uniref:ABC-type Fe3+-hydroxamate transport system substrate-binding protein n=1 Tax=Rufibacter quisquiliarum TaxID=1549639 RepID=A0A839GMI7_9BACT|nr:ABC-type Fe3+-hydroxamate transport system substrate-binding protein [Rufibacter quisquiliarum]